MLNNLKQFVPATICLLCDGCCRFKEESSLWRPKLNSNELSSRIFERTVAKDGRLKTCCVSKEHLCSFFNPEDHTCHIYTKRPFECQLYPFLLHHRDGKVVLSVHLLCPYVQQTKAKPIFQEYTKYLQNYFNRVEVRDYLHNNFHLDDYSFYQDELEDVLIID